jgi:hypothetical protein
MNGDILAKAIGSSVKNGNKLNAAKATLIVINSFATKPNEDENNFAIMARQKFASGPETAINAVS